MTGFGPESQIELDQFRSLNHIDYRSIILAPFLQVIQIRDGLYVCVLINHLCFQIWIRNKDTRYLSHS